MTKLAIIVPQRADMEKYIEAVNKLTQRVEQVVLKKPADVDRAQMLLRDIHDAEKALTAHREEITRPIMTGLAQIREMFKNPEQSLANLKKEAKSKILAHQIAEDEKAEKKRAQILARAEKGTMKAETAIEKIGKLQDLPTANLRIVRKLEIFDETILPRIFLVPDREAITRALFAGASVDGARLKEEKSVAVARV